MAPFKKTYFFLAIFLMLIILLIAFFVYLVFREIKNNSEAFLSEKEKITSLSKEEENRKQIEELYKNYQSDFNKIEESFADPEAPINFIDFLEKTASVSQAQLKILSMVKKNDKKDPWPSLLFQLSLTGSFSNFSKFLEKLENSPYLIETTDLNIRALAEKETKSKEFGNLPSADTDILLSIKVFTQNN